MHYLAGKVFGLSSLWIAFQDSIPIMVGLPSFLDKYVNIMSVCVPACSLHSKGSHSVQKNIFSGLIPALWHHKGLIQERWDEERRLLRIVHRALLLLAAHCRKYENGKTKEDTALCDVSKSINSSLVLVFETAQPYQVSVLFTSKHGEGPTSAEESFTQKL